MGICCPFCKKEIALRLIIENKGQMSRFYAYCSDCKCSIVKTIKRREEEDTKKRVVEEGKQKNS